MNIRELDEESRRTGVWPPRRIILRVERDADADAAEAETNGRGAAVKVGEVDLAAPPRAAAPAKPRAVPAPPPRSLSPSVTPSRRPGLPGSRGVTPAPAVSPEDAAFDKWLAEPLAIADSEPEYQAPPEWLPDDVRVRAQRRHRRVARKARTQLFGASAATTLAVGGCAAALGLVGLSQTEAVGGSLGVPSIGLFGSAPQPSGSDRTADTAAAKPAPKKAERKPAPRRETSRSTAPRRATPAAPSNQVAGNQPRAATPQRSSAPRPATVSPPPQARRPVASNPPPPPPPPAPTTQRRPTAPTTSSAPRPSAPVQPSRPATSTPTTSSSPAPSQPSLGSEPAL